MEFEISITANAIFEAIKGALHLHLQNLLQGGSVSDSATGRHSGSNNEHMNWAALVEHRESRRYLNKTVSSSVKPAEVPFWLDVKS